MSQEFISLPAGITKETEKAVLVNCTFPSPNENYGMNCWLPKSQIEIQDIQIVSDKAGYSWTIATITVPTWLTRKNAVMMNNPKAHYAK